MPICKTVPDTEKAAVTSAAKVSLITKIPINSGVTAAFAAWQAQLNAAVAAWPEFASIEILAPSELVPNRWTIVQSFYTADACRSWYQNPERIGLMQHLKPMLDGGSLSEDIQERIEYSPTSEHVTELIVTEVSPEKEASYRQWIARIHQLEAKFPGFRGVYVQPPRQGLGRHWITLLQFDTVANLEQWLSSHERQAVLAESQSLITSLENHRISSPYGGWFASVVHERGKVPALWKQTMVVLLMLFPLVMIETRLLSPWTASFNGAVAMFIANGISAAMLSWALMPVAVRALHWWLVPQGLYQKAITIVGSLLVIMLYVAEIVLLWEF